MTRDDAVLLLLRRLEAENRFYKRALAAGLGVALLACLAAAVEHSAPQDKKPTPPGAIQDILRTRRLEIADARGAVVAVLQAAEEKEEPGWLSDFHDNGRRKWRAQVANNRYEGQFTAWWPNGLEQEKGTYLKGRKHGLFTTYHQNGQPHQIGAYSDGLRTGIWTEWHDNGQKKAEGVYDDDRKTDTWKTWHANGKPASVATYKADCIHGTFESWFDNGQRKWLCEYRDNVLIGAYRSWHANGQAESEGTFDEHGRRSGEWKFWKKDRTVDEQRSGRYENNKRVQ